MKIINNTDKLKNFLDFSVEGSFYFGQLIQRKKDNPQLKRDNRVVQDFYIHSADEFDEKIGMIISMCHVLNARAYINVNLRKYEDVSYECLKILSDRLQKKEYRKNKGLWTTACGQNHQDPNKKWVVDIDDPSILTRIANLIEECMPVDQRKILLTLPTLNGYHLITKPFNTREFADKLDFLAPDPVTIHKNNPTILYAEKQ